MAVAVAVAGNCSSDLTPSLGTPYAEGTALKRQKKKKKKKDRDEEKYIPSLIAGTARFCNFYQVNINWYHVKVLILHLSNC